MKKIALIYIIMVIAMAIVIIISLRYVLNTITEEEDKFSVPIGERVIINKDTLTIVDYSMFNSTYKLSDDSTISSKYYIKLKSKGYVIEINN